MIFKLLFFCALAFATGVEIDQFRVVQSPTGSYQGKILKSYSGKDIYAFRGIRYADAPTGRNRFQQSSMVAPHQGIFDATQDGPLCPQPLNGNRIISEDCLRLNVYSNQLPTDSSNRLSLKRIEKPVFVFLHPGGFVSGSSYEYGPESMLDHDFVLVTLNYRLGALGFLSTGDSRAPGNAGLKDQVLALKWIQQNIRAFGGNPDSVVLVGHSAGAWSVAMHLVSPMSQSLFHRAVMMDGALPLHKPFPTNQLDVAKEQAKILECPVDTIDKMIDCLYTKSPEELGNSIAQLTDVNVYSTFVYTPVVEQANIVAQNYQPFITAQPIDIIHDKKCNFVPTSIGFDSYAINIANIDTHSDSESMKQLNENWANTAPKLFGYEQNPRSSFISNELKSFYFQNQPITMTNYQTLFELYDDALTIFPAHRFGQLLTTYSPEPVRFYHDLYKCCKTHPQWSNGTHFSQPHYDELTIFFPYDRTVPPCEQDVKATEGAMNLFIEFAKTGQMLGWDAMTTTKPQYFEYNSTSARMVTGYIHQERMNKWDELFPLDPPQRH